MKPRTDPMLKTFEEWIADPRKDSDFSAKTRLPACEGGEWPGVGASGPIERQQIEFLAVYSHLNRLREELKMARKKKAADSEQRILLNLNRAIGFRDQLEDRYMPVGFYAEPVLEDEIYVNLVFHYSQKQILENHRRHAPMDVTLKVRLPSKKLMKATTSVPGIPTEKILADLSWPQPKQTDRPR